MRRMIWAFVMAAGCSDPMVQMVMGRDDTATEVATEAGSDETTETPTDATALETGDTASETTGTGSETLGSGSETTGTGSETRGSDTGSGSATEDTGSGVDTGSGSASEVDTGTDFPSCTRTCVENHDGCILGTVEAERCDGAEAGYWCCDPVVADTGSDTETVSTCTGTCSNWSGCGGDWHKIDGYCPSYYACCEQDTDTGSETVDTDTNPEPCPQDNPLYTCEWRGHCTTAVGTEDTNYYCNDPNNNACCRHYY